MTCLGRTGLAEPGPGSNRQDRHRQVLIWVMQPQVRRGAAASGLAADIIHFIQAAGGCANSELLWAFREVLQRAKCCASRSS